MISTNRKTTFWLDNHGCFLSLLLQDGFQFILQFTSSFEGNFNIYDIQSPCGKTDNISRSSLQYLS